MAQISSLGALPDPVSRIPAGTPATSAGKSAALAKSTPTSTGSDETQASPLQAQLTRLSAVLNGLQGNAATSRAQYVQALNEVKSGTYQVNSAQVSHSIVNDLLSDSGHYTA